MSTTIRVSEQTRDRLAALAAAMQRPMTAVVDEALDELERRRFFGAFNERWSELREDSTAWPEIEGERLAEEDALRDGGT